MKVFRGGFALTFVVLVRYTDRDVAPIFGHLSPRQDHTDERSFSSLLALLFPAAASARNVAFDHAALQENHRPRHDPPPLRSELHASSPAPCECSLLLWRKTTSARSRRGPTSSPRCGRPRPLHNAWHAISTGAHVVSEIWTFGVGVEAARMKAYGPGGPAGPSRSPSGCGSRLARSARSASGCSSCSLDVPASPRAQARGSCQDRSGGGAANQDRRVLAPRGGPLHARSGISGDLSPMTQTRFGQAFIVMPGFAVVWRHLPVVAPRQVVLLTGVIGSIVPRGSPVSGHARPGVVVADRGRRLGHIAAASLWIGGLATMVLLVWYGAPESGAPRSSASRGSRWCSSRSCSAPGVPPHRAAAASA